MDWLVQLIEAILSAVTTPHNVPDNPVAHPPITSPNVAPTNPPIALTDIIYKTASAACGSDVSPIENELGCAESVSNILHKAYSDFPGEVLGTALLNQKLMSHPHFRTTLDPKPGVVIMSPTVGDNHGHCGIFGAGGTIMSNSSFTYKWDYNYTLDEWAKYFRLSKGLHVYFYERI